LHNFLFTHNMSIFFSDQKPAGKTWYLSTSQKTTTQTAEVKLH